MGKKKGKKQGDNESESTGDGGVQAPTPGTDNTVTPAVDPPVAKGGKKGKKKKAQFDDEDIEADLLLIASEGNPNLTKPDDPVKLEPAPVKIIEATPTEQMADTPPVKKGKKGRKKDWEEVDVLQELEDLDNKDEVGNDATDVKKNKKDKKKNKKDNDGDIDKLLMDIEGLTVSGGVQPTEKPTSIQENEEEEETQVKTKSEKKLAKKERQKEAKKQAKQGHTQTMPIAQVTPIDQATPSVTGVKPMEDVASDQTVSISPVDEGGTNEPVEEETSEPTAADEEIDDDKKKKKKKKKDDKKPAGAAAAAKVKKPKNVVMMKEKIEALRLAQKKREEEQLAKLRAEEEAERLRLEKIRLEKERKEKRKQKEKERRDRLRKEGKLLSKSEKERRVKAEMQLQALEAQGIHIPQKGETGSTKKGPVRYGSRTRKPKQQQQTSEMILEGEEEETESMTTDYTDETTPTITSTNDSEDGVKANWDDDDDDEVKDNWDDEDDEVKDNWDDEDDEDEEEEDDDIKQSPMVGAGPEVEATPTVDHVSASEDESDSSSSEEDDEEEDEETPYDRAAKRIQERRQRHHSERSPELLRSPVVCVLGHVDTGKTKILDKIRHTNVQDGEAGGITQQIGATFVPQEAIMEQTKMMKEFQKAEIKVPGLLIIDTPGHESFSNLRTRGSSMCDIAILVVDIMHGLEPQTIESLNLLKKGNVPFVVALNKIDRLLDWRRNPTGSVKETIKRQKPNTKAEFDERIQGVILEFAEQGLNAALYWDKVDFKEYIPLVPTSAHSGDGMGDLISHIVTQSETNLVQSLMFSKEVEAIVLEVKVIAGLGTTIDVILRNGILNEGDTLVLMGMEGPFVAQGRALLMPQPLRELRVKNAYINHKTIIASQGVKITGKDLEKTLAGTPVLVAKRPDEIDVLKDEASSNMTSLLNSFKLSERGVFVQASTLGSLEALVEFLKSSKIPYAGVNIGPVHKKDIMKASVMLERDNQWACVLAFDVRVEREAQEMADNLGVRIFTADIIYHLFDSFMKYREELKERRRRENEHIATFPCKLKILPNCVFNARNPIIVGVAIVSGIVKPGTPLVVPTKDFVNIGTIVSIENNHKPVDIANKGSEVCIKIEPSSGEAPKLFGRHFDYDDMLVSKISRESIDAVKKYFRDDLQKADWQLMIELKKLFQIY